MGCHWLSNLSTHQNHQGDVFKADCWAQYPEISDEADSMGPKFLLKDPHFESYDPKPQVVKQKVSDHSKKGPR